MSTHVYMCTHRSKMIFLNTYTFTDTSLNTHTPVEVHVKSMNVSGKHAQTQMSQCTAMYKNN